MIVHVPVTDSTNRLARNLAAEGAAAGTVVWADRQEAGRGQHGRTFASPPGGLYFSLLLRPDILPENLPLITLVTGLACRDLLAAKFSVEPTIKWPNDLYLEDKKLVGILCENYFDSTQNVPAAAVIIGVGININTRSEDFPVDLQNVITSIYEHTHETADLEQVLESVVAEITRMVSRLSEEKDFLLDRWRAYDYLKDKPLQYIHDQQKMFGTGKGLMDDGRYTFLDTSNVVHAIIGGHLKPCQQQH